MNKTLLKLDISGRMFFKMIIVLRVSKSVLKTTGNAIEDEGTKMICEVLKANQTMKELCLWGLLICY